MSYCWLLRFSNLDPRRAAVPAVLLDHLVVVPVGRGGVRACALATRGLVLQILALGWRAALNHLGKDVKVSRVSLAQCWSLSRLSDDDSASFAFGIDAGQVQLHVGMMQVERGQPGEVLSLVLVSAQSRLL